MKFKEKDPIVSMEQWFPRKEEYEFGIGEEEIEGVVDINATKVSIIQYKVLQNNNRDHAEKLYFVDESKFDYISEQVKVCLVEENVNGRTDFVIKMGPRYIGSGGQYHCLAILSPGDWILTYQSGRREVLTDKEKQERFE